MRVFPNMFGQFRLPEEGGYGQDNHGRWFMRRPGEDTRQLHSRDVIPGPGDTITVSGYITAGEWFKP